VESKWKNYRIIVFPVESLHKKKPPITEGEIVRRGSRGRRRKQLLCDLTKKRRYWKLKEEALDVGSSLWKSQ